MYSVPAREETGILKELLEPGSKKQEEEKLVLASKMAGLTLTYLYALRKE
jgi:hypothetical protein